MILTQSHQHLDRGAPIFEKELVSSLAQFEVGCTRKVSECVCTVRNQLEGWGNKAMSPPFMVIISLILGEVDVRYTSRVSKLKSGNGKVVKFFRVLTRKHPLNCC